MKKRAVNLIALMTRVDLLVSPCVVLLVVATYAHVLSLDSLSSHPPPSPSLRTVNQIVCAVTASSIWLEIVYWPSLLRDG